MMITILFIILKIIGANPEVEDHSEANIMVNLSEVKIPMVEASKIKMHTKVNIKAPIIKAITTKVITVSSIIHAEVITKAIVTANLEAGVVVTLEVITVVAATANPIIEAKLIINTISIMVMMITNSMSNMAQYVHYVVVTTTLLDIVLRENMILIISVSYTHLTLPTILRV